MSSGKWLDPSAFRLLFQFRLIIKINIFHRLNFIRNPRFLLVTRNPIFRLVCAQQRKERKCLASTSAGDGAEKKRHEISSTAWNLLTQLLSRPQEKQQEKGKKLPVVASNSIKRNFFCFFSVPSGYIWSCVHGKSLRYLPATESLPVDSIRTFAVLWSVPFGWLQDRPTLSVAEERRWRNRDNSDNLIGILQPIRQIAKQLLKPFTCARISREE